MAKRNSKNLKDYEFYDLVDHKKTFEDFGYDVSNITMGANRKLWFNCSRCKQSACRPVYHFTEGITICQECRIQDRANLVAEKKKVKRQLNIEIVPTAKLIEHKEDGIAVFECLIHKTQYDARKGNIINSFNRFGSNSCPVCIGENTGSSLIEKEMFQFVFSLSEDAVSQFRIPPYSADIYVPNKKLILEMDGLYFHSDAIKKDKNELQIRKKFLDGQGFLVINIFEHEWKNKRLILEEKIKTLLGIDVIKYRAEQLHIGKIESTLAKNFLQQHHLMGAGELRSDMCYGMFNDQLQLICVCTFTNERVGNKRNISTIFELNRYAAIGKVYGAMIRFIHLFKKDFPIATELYSYANYRFSSSKQNVYLASGFIFDKLTEPGYFWHKYHQVLPRHKTQKHLLPILLGKNFDPLLTEELNMYQNGWSKVHDAGHLKYKMPLN